MENKKLKNKSFYNNLLSIFVLAIFIVIEVLYLNVIPNNLFKRKLKSNLSNVLYTAIASDSELEQVCGNELEQLGGAGKYVENEKISFNGNYRFATASEIYFDNTLFIGDSRMLGFSVYKQIPGASYYCYQSADAFTILEKEHEFAPYGMISLYNLLSLKRFDKIYISLGINNVAAGFDNHKKHYKHLLDTVRSMQPNAIIYLLGNLHVTSQMLSNNIYLNNENINYINKFISEFEDKKQVFYLDPNVVYDNEFGNMDVELSYDNAHIYLRHYDRLYNFLITHAVVYDE